TFQRLAKSTLPTLPYFAANSLRTLASPTSGVSPSGTADAKRPSASSFVSSLGAIINSLFGGVPPSPRLEGSAGGQSVARPAQPRRSSTPAAQRPYDANRSMTSAIWASLSSTGSPIASARWYIAASVSTSTASASARSSVSPS